MVHLSTAGGLLRCSHQRRKWTKPERRKRLSFATNQTSKKCGSVQCRRSECPRKKQPVTLQHLVADLAVSAIFALLGLSPTDQRRR
ncbi:uncharacterized protein M421DRAFT_424154 [Didymella exigua CBS 183.55]|uniref:Uncharacterized protein n=1 Tax=Didymella exigua CBS 183.55 TaxID=1150837 RepID=A0A6A5RDD6_9PLEO|nr:uncharacterized protein M421DRAFT_424154 [Didymella exigua CBS 183.55]KAF1925124.1 hypothetical protein M421DRAFT_424154 [Didymella exigua CBS 183.55]